MTRLRLERPPATESVVAFLRRIAHALHRGGFYKDRDRLHAMADDLDSAPSRILPTGSERRLPRG